jgi:DNA-binding MarR family transcriptional regulator
VALARDLGVDAATMTRATDKLVARGWVERQRSCTDRRLVELHITPQGQHIAQQLKPVLTQTLNAHLAGFSMAEWQQLMGFLHRMQANAMRMAPIAPPCVNIKKSSSIDPGESHDKRKRQDTG